MRFRGDLAKSSKRISVTITPEIEAWFFKVRKQLKAQGGYLLPKTYIARALLRAAKELSVDLTAVKDERDLQRRFEAAMKRR